MTATADHSPIPASLKGDTGWLVLDISTGAYRYGVTMDEQTATLFPNRPKLIARHTALAMLAGIRIEQSA